MSGEPDQDNLFLMIRRSLLLISGLSSGITLQEVNPSPRLAAGEGRAEGDRRGENPRLICPSAAW